MLRREGPLPGSKLCSFGGLCGPWKSRACLDSRLTQNAAWDAVAPITNIITVGKRPAGVFMEEF